MILTQTDIELVEKVSALERFIGKTPLLPLERVLHKKSVKLYAKLEWQQFSGSVKARPAFNIIKEAVLSGELDRERGILDASSGNTAIAYAAIGAALNIPVTICLPENASPERKLLLKAYGADVIYTSKFGTTDEAQEKAQALYRAAPDRYFYANQYGNENNWKAHYEGTGEEIFEQTQGKITHFVAGLGTTGSFTGTGRKLKILNPTIHLTSLQPDTALHGLEGWKHLETALVPKIYDAELAHENLWIDTFESYQWIKEAADKEGLLLSPSAAANLIGALKVAEEIEEGVIVTLFPDNGEKYGEVMKEIF